MANVQSGLSKFLWKRKSRKLHELVADLLNAYQTVRHNMSLKMHILHSQLDFFPPNLGRSERRTWGKFLPGCFRHGEKICGKSSEKTLGDYCRSLTEDGAIANYKRMSCRRKFKHEYNHLFSHFYCVTA